MVIWWKRGINAATIDRALIGDERFSRRVVCTLPMKCKQTKTIHQTLLHQRDKKVRVRGVERSACYREINEVSMKFCVARWLYLKLPTSLSNFFCQVQSTSLLWPENQIRSPTRRVKFSRNRGQTKPAQPALEESPCEAANRVVKERFSLSLSPTLRRLGPKWSVAARKTEKNKKWSDGNFSKRR